MKYLLICSALLFTISSYAQKNDCAISIVTDDFNGKKKVHSKNTLIMEKLYLGDAMLGVTNKSPWRLTAGFWKEDELLLCVKHESSGHRETSIVDALDIKFKDGTVITLDAPIDGTFTKLSLKENQNQSTFFKLSKEQLATFSTGLIVKTRVKFRDNPNDQVVEKELNSARAEKLQKEANCFRETISKL